MAVADRRRVFRCRQCQARCGWKSRGLCGTCFSNPIVRSLFPARRPPRVEQPKSRVPARYATEAPPGSEEKIITMSMRASRGEDIFHPDDCMEANAAARPGDL